MLCSSNANGGTQGLWGMGEFVPKLALTLFSSQNWLNVFDFSPDSLLLCFSWEPFSLLWEPFPLAKQLEIKFNSHLF